MTENGKGTVEAQRRKQLFRGWFKAVLTEKGTLKLGFEG